MEHRARSVHGCYRRLLLLICQCILLILHLFGTLLVYLKSHCNPKKLFSQYLEFWINQLRKNTDVYCIHTVCNMVQGISREKTVHLPSCVTAIIREKFNSPDFLGFKYSQT